MTELEQLPDAPATAPTDSRTTQSNATKAARPRKKVTKNQIISEFSIRKPTWAYIHLQHLSSSSSSAAAAAAAAPAQTALDGVTAQLHLHAAMTSFLGLHGAAIPIDILALREQDVWIRVPADDRAAVLAAAGGWMSGGGEGWRVRGWSHWNASAWGRDAGQDLFD